MCLYFPCDGPAELSNDLVGEAVVFGAAPTYLGTLLRDYARTLLVRPELGSELAGPLLRTITHGVDAFLADMNGRSERLSASKRSTRLETLRRLELARSFIHAHAGATITLEQIARHAALSRFHLTRTFSEVYGEPPLSYHRRLRLDDAAAKLSAGSHNATQLAEELGYASLSAFARAFRQHAGVPPGRLALR
jgi:AraC-like DNA-binding protein